MKFIKFKITNFKGINDLEIDLTKKLEGKIFPFVGLNESGKTTILEAINLFQNPVLNKEEIKKLRHKAKLANFTDTISVSATLSLDDETKQKIQEFLSKKNLQAKNIPDEIIISRKYDFRKNIESENIFISEFPSRIAEVKAKGKGRRSFQKLYDYGDNHEIWNELVEMLEESLPKILYFKNFLFDFPEKIYLEEVDNDNGETRNETQNEYRKILQDILDSLDKNYSLQEHILDRIKNRVDKDALDAVLNQMSEKLNKTIIKSWEEVFTNNSKKNLEIEDDNDANKHYLQFRMKENNNNFSINERSLGFRWFFSFLLFTEFRKAREEEKGEYLFLFDEPASNLHQKHQQKLLEQFEKLTDKAKIIYTTHSSYLLKSDFLLTSFIVKDKGIKEGEIENESQDIKAIPYREFVGNSPESIDDFKPLLDTLEYVENPFEKTNNIVFFEGKNDYYTFKWIKENYFENQYDFNLYPGGGVTKYRNTFREYLANNKNFIAIFDDDEEGKKAKGVYIESISQELEKNIFTLRDIDENFDGSQAEKLFSDKEKLEIQKKYFPNEESYNKSKFNVAIQELFIKKENGDIISSDTLAKFKTIFDFIKSKFEEQN